MASEAFLDQIAEHEYDQAFVPELEQYVRNNPYDRRVVRALLKLYQAFPATANDDIIVECLVKALMALPSTDFLSFRYLLPFGIVDRDSRYQAVFAMAELLETGKFIDVWASANNEPFTRVVGFKDEIRRYILGAIAQTCRSMRKDTFCNFLGIRESDLAELKILSNEIGSIEDNLVILRESTDNRPRPKLFTETLRFEEVVRTLSTLH